MLTWAPAPADHGHVVGHGAHGLGRAPVAPDDALRHRRHGDVAAEPDRVGRLRPHELPGVAFREPGLRSFLLPAILQRLPEQAVIVADAVADRRDREARHAFHEAGGEAPEAAIAERGVRLGRFHVAEVDTELTQGGPRGRDQAEVVHGVGQEPADEEFEREIIDALVRHRPLVVHAGIDDAVAQSEGGRGEPVALTGVAGRLSDDVGQLGQDRLAQVGDVVARRHLGRNGACRRGKSLGRLLLVRNVRGGCVVPADQVLVQHVSGPPLSRPWDMVTKSGTATPKVRSSLAILSILRSSSLQSRAFIISEQCDKIIKHLLVLPPFGGRTADGLALGGCPLTDPQGVQPVPGCLPGPAGWIDPDLMKTEFPSASPMLPANASRNKTT